MIDGTTSPPRLSYAAGYRRSMGLEYRGPARLVHPPAVVQHLGYWIADAGLDNRGEFFRSFSDAIRIKSRFEYATPPSAVAMVDRVRRHQTFHLKCPDWQSLEVKITLDLHHEYLTISAIIELPDLDSDSPNQGAVRPRLAKAILELRRELISRREEFSPTIFSSTPQRMRDVRQRLTGPYREIFIDFWDEFYEQILRKPTSEMTGVLRKPFADFRGFIANAELGPGFFLLDSPSFKRKRSAQPFPAPESAHRAHAILPFMTADSENIKSSEEKELTVTRFLDGRAIYASTLGAQSPESPESPEQPLTYFILTNAISSWQTGRLVDCIHSLGCVRLAARSNLSELSEAGDRLHDLEKEIEEMDPLVQNRAGLDADPHQVTRTISDAYERLHGISRLIPGGLPYRVERSRYYRSQFASLLPSLRIGTTGRVEGFQPYDKFVERRFGSSYEFIDMIGKRFVRLENQLSVFYQRVRTAEMAQQTEKIELLQEVAEKGFFLVLAPYYIGSILSHLMHPALPFLTTWIVPGLWPKDPQEQVAALEAGLFLGSWPFSLFLFWSFKRARRKRAGDTARQAEIDKHSRNERREHADFTKLNLS